MLRRDESSIPGLWQTKNTPYLKKIMDCYTDLTTEVIAFIKSSQIGATESAINICGYVIERDPSRLLYVMPDEDVAKDFGRERLLKALRNCPTIAPLLPTRPSSLLVKYPGGTLFLAGAQSPAKLASWAIPRVIMDEVDKYPRWTGREASPVSLVEERTKNWPSRKILVMSTPTTEYGNINQAYINSDVRYKFYLPCPECGHWQPLEFQHLKFPKEKTGGYDVLRVKKEAYYLCPHCQHHITERDKREMLEKGRWVAENKSSGIPRKVGFHINSMYSPWVSFGEVAAKFVESKDDPSKLMNFVNSWLGEPWKSKASNMEVSAVMNQRTNLPTGIVPKWAQILTGGVDCQQGYFYWTIRAWGAGITSQKIACGQATTFGDVRQIMDTFWPVEDSPVQKVQVVLYCIDTGYNTENVYDFCYENMNIAIPVKGSSRQMPKRYSITPIQPNEKRLRPLNLYVVDTDQYKNIIQAHMNKPVGSPGAWMVDADTTRDYAEQICAEQKIIDETGKYPIETWKPITSSRANHYLDCEVYATVAASIMNVRYLAEKDQRVSQAGGEVDPEAFIPKDFNFIPENGGNKR